MSDSPFGISSTCWPAWDGSSSIVEWRSKVLAVIADVQALWIGSNWLGSNSSESARQARAIQINALVQLKGRMSHSVRVALETETWATAPKLIAKLEPLMSEVLGLEKLLERPEFASTARESILRIHNDHPTSTLVHVFVDEMVSHYSFSPTVSPASKPVPAALTTEFDEKWASLSRGEVYKQAQSMADDGRADEALLIRHLRRLGGPQYMTALLFLPSGELSLKVVIDAMRDCDQSESKRTGTNVLLLPFPKPLPPPYESSYSKLPSALTISTSRLSPISPPYKPSYATERPAPPPAPSRSPEPSGIQFGITSILLKNSKAKESAKAPAPQALSGTSSDRSSLTTSDSSAHRQTAAYAKPFSHPATNIEPAKLETPSASESEDEMVGSESASDMGSVNGIASPVLDFYALDSPKNLDEPLLTQQSSYYRNNGRYSETICFRCHQPGHLSRECPTAQFRPAHSYFMSGAQYERAMTQEASGSPDSYGHQREAPSQRYSSYSSPQNYQQSSYSQYSDHNRRPTPQDHSGDWGNRSLQSTSGRSQRNTQNQSQNHHNQSSNRQPRRNQPQSNESSQNYRTPRQNTKYKYDTSSSISPSSGASPSAYGATPPERRTMQRPKEGRTNRRSGD